MNEQSLLEKWSQENKEYLENLRRIINQIEQELPPEEHFDAAGFISSVYIDGFDENHKPIINPNIDPNGYSMLQHKLSYYHWRSTTTSKQKSTLDYIAYQAQIGVTTDWY